VVATWRMHGGSPNKSLYRSIHWCILLLTIASSNIFSWEFDTRLSGWSILVGPSCHMIRNIYPCTAIQGSHFLWM
jgi:hypothetical protein